MKKLFTLSIVCLALILGFAVNSFAGDYFSSTEVQLHVEPSRDFGQDANTGKDKDKWSTLTLTTEHFTEWKYGDAYLFLDIEGKDDYSTEANQYYYEINPRFSFNKIFDLDLSTPLTGDIYFASIYSDGGPIGSADNTFDYIHRAWLYGLSIDFNFQPNYGFSNLTVFVRDEKNNDTSYMVKLAWGQPFQVGGLDLAFNGFAKIWENDTDTVFVTEPQLRLNLSSFVGKDNFLSKCSIGTEIEISRNFLDSSDDWIVNPTGFFAFSL